MRYKWILDFFRESRTNGFDESSLDSVTGTHTRTHTHPKDRERRIIRGPSTKIELNKGLIEEKKLEK